MAQTSSPRILRFTDPRQASTGHIFSSPHSYRPSHPIPASSVRTSSDPSMTPPFTRFTFSSNHSPLSFFPFFQLHIMQPPDWIFFFFFLPFFLAPFGAGSRPTLIERRSADGPRPSGRGSCRHGGRWSNEPSSLQRSEWLESMPVIFFFGGPKDTPGLRGIVTRAIPSPGPGAQTPRRSPGACPRLTASVFASPTPHDSHPR